MKTSEILGRMLPQYGVNCMVHKNVVEKFKHGRKTLDYEERSDRASISRKDDSCAEERKQITVSVISWNVGSSYGSPFAILTMTAADTESVTDCYQDS